ncbi:PI51C-like protein, partial [Mya arenaria]
MDASTDLDVSALRQIKTQMSESGQSDAGSSHGKGSGAVPKDRERKIGHRRYNEKTGLVTYKKKPTSELQAAIQLGIGQSVGESSLYLSLCDDPMTELTNPGAGGSIFYISADDEFIIKTAQHKEANFLQKLLP